MYFGGPPNEILSGGRGANWSGAKVWFPRATLVFPRGTKKRSSAFPFRHSATESQQWWHSPRSVSHKSTDVTEHSDPTDTANVHRFYCETKDEGKESESALCCIDAVPELIPKCVIHFHK